MLKGNPKSGVGNLRPAGRIRPAKQNHQVRSPFTNCNCMARLKVGYILWIFPPSTFFNCILMRNYLLETELCYRCAVFHILGFDMDCKNHEFIWLKVFDFPFFINTMNSKINKISGGKPVRPAIPCRVCFWPATKERLQTLDLKQSMNCRN